jgi:hypothetical protein
MAEMAHQLTRREAAVQAVPCLFVLLLQLLAPPSLQQLVGPPVQAKLEAPLEVLAEFTSNMALALVQLIQPPIYSRFITLTWPGHPRQPCIYPLQLRVVHIFVMYFNMVNAVQTLIVAINSSLSTFPIVSTVQPH